MTSRQFGHESGKPKRERGKNRMERCRGRNSNQSRLEAAEARASRFATSRTWARFDPQLNLSVLRDKIPTEPPGCPQPTPKTQKTGQVAKKSCQSSWCPRKGPTPSVKFWISDRGHREVKGGWSCLATVRL
jgi:hypothetical protein